MKKILILLFLPFVFSCSNNPIHSDNSSKLRKNEAKNITSPYSLPTLRAISKQFTGSGWNKESPPYDARRLVGDQINAFESNKGSQIFMVKYRTSDSNRRSANTFNGMTDLSAFNNAKISLISQPKGAVIQQRNGVKTYRIDFIASGNGKSIYSDQKIPTRYSSVYVPVQLPDGKFSTLLVQYRGRVDDQQGYQEFLNYIDGIQLPKGSRAVT